MTNTPRWPGAAFRTQSALHMLVFSTFFGPAGCGTPRDAAQLIRRDPAPGRSRCASCGPKSCGAKALCWHARESCGVEDCSVAAEYKALATSADGVHISRLSKRTSKRCREPYLAVHGTAELLRCAVRCTPVIALMNVGFRQAIGHYIVVTRSDPKTTETVNPGVGTFRTPTVNFLQRWSTFDKAMLLPERCLKRCSPVRSAPPRLNIGASDAIS